MTVASSFTNPGSSKIRPTVLETVERLQWQVTLGDVASQTGLPLSTARQELLSLAKDGGGSLQVSEDGDILYVFPKRIRQILAAKEVQDQWAQRRQKLWNFLLKAFRVSFGIFLILEFVLIVLAIFLLMTASSREGEDNRRRGGGINIFWFPNMWVGNPFWADPYPYERRRSRAGSGRRPQTQLEDTEEMNFLEAVYSFLFGDGDPNGDLEAERMRLIGQVIRQNNGVIVAEQVLPYLDVPYRESVEQEDFMVPILLAFDGQPEVSPEGYILYRFPELQISAAAKDSKESRTSLPSWLKERLWRFSRAGSGQITLALAFGIFNFVGAWWLELFARPALLSIGGLGALIANLLWLMVIYGTLFLVVPGVRWFVLQRRNQRVTERNAWRQSWRDKLLNPSPDLLRKLARLKDLGTHQVVDPAKVIYRSDQDLLEQPDPELNAPRWQALQDEPERQR